MLEEIRGTGIKVNSMAYSAAIKVRLLDPFLRLRTASQLAKNVLLLLLLLFSFVSKSFYVLSSV